MCFSKEVSATTFLLGMAGSLYIYFGMGSPTDKIIGAFLAYISLMQGIEYLLWDHQLCDEYHKAISYSGMWLSHMQPVVLGVLMLIFGNPEYRNWIWAIIAGYTAVIVPYSLQYDNVGDMRCSVPRAENPHLVWNWGNMPYCNIVYIIFLAAFVALFMLGMKKNGAWLAGISVATFLISNALYPRESMGAIWCFFAAFVPMGYILLKYRGLA
jgi:hypothetical protein